LQQGGEPFNDGILYNKFEMEKRQKQVAIHNKQKMAVYQNQIKELYMPKASEKKAYELQKMKMQIKTNARERKPHENYLDFVKD